MTRSAAARTKQPKEETRADYVKCVRRVSKAEQHMTYCGREPDNGEWTFFSPDHAVEHGMSASTMNGHKLEACAECRKVIAKALAGKIAKRDQTPVAPGQANPVIG